MRSAVAVVPALVASAWLAPTSLVPSRAAERELTAEDILARSRAVYASLKSYADSGTVADEVKGYTDHAKFKTYFRRPGYFFFEFKGVGSKYSNGFFVPSAAHHVVWMSAGELETWHAQLRDHRTFPRAAGGQVNALAGTAAGTDGTGTLIPSLLFSQSGIVATIQELVEVSVAGTENVRGHPCHKLVGVARSVYPSGRVTNVRPVTVWIDARTLLIRKVLEDTPKGAPMGTISRRTITIDPQLNPPLGDDKFRFAVPETQE